MAKGDILEEAIELQGDEAVQLPDQVVKQYESLLAAVPDAGGSGYEGILATIAGAESPADLDAPWRSVETDGLTGVPLTILSVTKAPSDYIGGLPYFLVVQAVRRDTSAYLTFTTGSVSMVAQLAKAWALEAFPWKCHIEEAGRPNRFGKRLQHLVNDA